MLFDQLKYVDELLISSLLITLFSTGPERGLVAILEESVVVAGLVAILEESVVVAGLVAILEESVVVAGLVAILEESVVVAGLVAILEESVVVAGLVAILEESVVVAGLVAILEESVVVAGLVAILEEIAFTVICGLTTTNCVLPRSVGPFGRGDTRGRETGCPSGIHASFPVVCNRLPSWFDVGLLLL